MKNLRDYGIIYKSLQKIKRFETNFKKMEGSYRVVKSSDKVIHKTSLFLGFEMSSVVARKSLVCQRTFGAGLLSHKLNLTIKWENRKNSQYNHFIRYTLEEKKKKPSTFSSLILVHYWVIVLFKNCFISFWFHLCHFSYLTLPYINSSCWLSN